VSRTTFGSLPWRSRSQPDLAARSSPVHNFVIWCRILQLLLTNCFSVSNTYSGSITRFRPALVLMFVASWCSTCVCVCVCRFVCWFVYELFCHGAFKLGIFVALHCLQHSFFEHIFHLHYKNILRVHKILQ